jgi:hypothetical protein
MSSVNFDSRLQISSLNGRGDVLLAGKLVMRNTVQERDREFGGLRFLNVLNLVPVGLGGSGEARDSIAGASNRHSRGGVLDSRGSVLLNTHRFTVKD